MDINEKLRNLVNEFLVLYLLNFKVNCLVVR